MSAFNLKPSEGKGEYSVPPAGSHPAVMVALVDLGTQENDYQGVKSKARKVFLVWELTSEKDEKTGKNFIVGRDYTSSLNEKAALRHIVEKCRGKALTKDEEFDVRKMLGKQYLITLVHKESGKGNSYAKIDAVGPLPKGMACPPATTSPFQWEIDGDISKLPEWLPYVYGDKVPDVIAFSDERRGGGAPKARSKEPAPGGTVVNNDELAAMF